MTHGIFHAFGLFWRLDEVNWTPGKGNRKEFRLLGRRGRNRPGLLLADFRDSPGVYILYGNYGPYYAGLTHQQSLGKRLKDHLFDKHKGRWDRFSWFSFRQVLTSKDSNGMQRIGRMPTVRSSDPQKAMKDIEALLIKAMALTNIAQMNFTHADEWAQVKKHEVKMFCQKALDG